MLSPLQTAPASAQKVPTRSILLLAAAGFAAQAQVRVTDSLLPQIATDFQTTVGVAAIVVTAYAVTHGTIQFVVGPVADRFGKYRTVAIISVLAAVLVDALRHGIDPAATRACAPRDRRRRPAG